MLIIQIIIMHYDVINIDANATNTIGTINIVIIAFFLQHSYHQYHYP